MKEETVQGPTYVWSVTREVALGATSCIVGAIPCGIDSNKIDLMPQLRSLLGLGPLAWLTLALGVASLLTRLQDLWRGRSDPGGIDKGHLRLEAETLAKRANIASPAPPIGQRRRAPLPGGSD